MTKKMSFTIAELLITLTILGIVAIITIANTVSGLSKREMETRFKIAYNMLTNLVDKINSENIYAGEIYPSNRNTTETFNTYLRPNLHIIKDCGTTGLGCFAGPDGGWYSIDNDNGNGYGVQNFYKVVLKNGMSLAAGFNATAGFNIFVDINGPKKGYSKLGQDTFLFSWVSPRDLQTCASCTAHQSSMPELIPGPIEYNHGASLNTNYIVNTIYYYSPTVLDRGICKGYSDAEINYNNSAKERIKQYRNNYQGNDMDWWNIKTAQRILRNARNENNEPIFTEDEINAYYSVERRNGLGVSSGANCSIDIVKNGLKFPNNYPWNYVNQKPDNFHPIR